jgi:putative transposase
VSGTRRKPGAKHLNWGGARAGSGRKPKHGVALVSHRPRNPIAPGRPVLAAAPVRSDRPSLRGQLETLRAALAASRDRFAFRVVHWAVRDHLLLLLVEAKNRDQLRRGMQGLLIRSARGLNRAWRQPGKVWNDRYQDVVLRTPRAVRDALVLLFEGSDDFAGRRAGQVPSSAPWFDGFAAPLRVIAEPELQPPVEPPRSRLLSRSWRALGRIAFAETAPPDVLPPHPSRLPPVRRRRGQGA